MANFNDAVEETLKFEGGYANNPKDPGGETNFGISKRSYPDLDIKNLTVDQAKQIYEHDYWRPLRLDALFYQPLANSIFDFAVNAGKKRSAIILQMAINTSVIDKRFNPLKLDGVIGNKTISRLKFQSAEEYVFYIFSRLRLKFYLGLAAKPEKRQFLYSWVRRI